MSHAFALLAGLLTVFSPARRAGHEAGDAFARRRYADAAAGYAAAREKDPGEPAWTYDLGTSQAMAGQKAAARESLAGAARSPDPRVASAAYYQLGTMDLDGGRYAAAAGELRRSLELDPARPDAKRNYELALRNLRTPPPPRQPRQREPTPPAPSPSPRPSPPRESRFESHAGMSRAEADALLRALDAEQQRRERVAPPPRGRDW